MNIEILGEITSAALNCATASSRFPALSSAKPYRNRGRLCVGCKLAAWRNASAAATGLLSISTIPRFKYASAMCGSRVIVAFVLRLRVIPALQFGVCVSQLEMGVRVVRPLARCIFAAGRSRRRNCLCRLRLAPAGAAAPADRSVPLSVSARASSLRGGGCVWPATTAETRSQYQKEKGSRRRAESPHCPSLGRAWLPR